MELNLIFKDQFVENEFKNSLARTHQKSFLILTISLVLQSSGIYFSNPLDIDIFEKNIFLAFIFSMVAVILGYLLIRLRFPKHSERGISLYVFSFTMCAAEFIHIIQSSINLGSWVYFLLGINIQTGCLFLLISQVRWTQSIFIISTAHIYSWFRVIDIVSISGVQKTALISLAIHILFFFTLTYTNEKELRTSFQKIRADGYQLNSFDEIIKSFMGSAMFIMREDIDDDVVFINDAAKSLFNIKSKLEVHDLLRKIQIVSNKNRYFRESSNSLMAEFFDSKGHDNISLYKYYKNFIIHKPRMSENSSTGFKYLDGEINFMEDEPKSFSIQLGSTYWKGAESIIIIMNDVSSIKNHFRSLDCYKDSLLATVSHDLRTPLNGILGILELLYEEIEDESKKEKLLITITSAKLLLNMINDILDFSLISKGKLRMKFETTNIKALVEETTQIMRLQAEMKGLKLIVESSLAEEENYFVDNNRLRQVLLNLVGNAIKFTSEGHVIVRIYGEDVQSPTNEPAFKSIIIDQQDNTKKEDQLICADLNVNSIKLAEKNYIFSLSEFERKRLVFEVEDTGIGIKDEDIDKLFRLFSRVTSGHDRNMNGIGLGLAISQSLVILMNNKQPDAIIKVVSKYGRGSKFTFPVYIDSEPRQIFKEGKMINPPNFIKVKEQNLKNKNTLTRSQNKAGLDLFAANNKFKKWKIMVVDDDQINIYVASTFLKSLENKITFVTAGNGKDALDKVKSLALCDEFFDVFLMDCNMPIMNGYEASKGLKSMMNDNIIPWASIVAITANISSSDKERCYDSGMDLFLTKPYNKSQLTKIIEEAMAYYK